MKIKNNNFEILRKQSPFCNLSLGNNTINWDRCHTRNFYPYAYILNEDHSLQKLDQLIETFEIEERGSKDFKERIKDGILKTDITELNQYNAMESALSELLIADFLSGNEKILDLEAWKENGLGFDIKSKNEKTGIVYYTEVKYLGQIPELATHINNQNVPVSSIWPPDVQILYTYTNMRIVDATIQLNKLSFSPNEKKRCFLLLKSSITSNNTIIQAIQDQADWNDNKLSNLCTKLKLAKSTYDQKSIS
ncbi:MAG: hypothetical protein Q7S13_02880, partial [Candidatus Omnitrophota bacterium]|nr:hypothetical protein [Candidatus Omnitrophota bacterium]